MNRTIAMAWGAVLLGLAATATAQSLTVAETRAARNDLAAALGQQGACGDLVAVVPPFLDRGLEAGDVAEAAMGACREQLEDPLYAVVWALVSAGVPGDVAAQAAIFAGGDPVAVGAALERAGTEMRARGDALAYSPTPETRGLDRSEQLAPAQFAPVLLGGQVRDAGPDRTTLGEISPSSP